MCVELVVDVVLIVLGLAAVVSSWRRGALVAVAVAVGWFAGLWIGFLLAPDVVAFALRIGWVTPAWRTLVAGLAVLLCAGICNALLVGLASALRRGLHHLPVAGGLDALGGGVIGLLTWAVVVWLLAGFVQATDFRPLTQAAGSSRVVAALDSIAPVPVARALGPIEDAFASIGLPKVFEGTEAIPEVAAPDSTIPAAVGKASAGVVEVLADEPQCGTESTGSGWVLASGKVVTNAHVVAGSATASVRIGGTGREWPAMVVSFDPETDLAVLSVPGLPLAPLATGSAEKADASAYVAGYPGGGPYSVAPARVRAVLNASGKDIYDDKTVTREVYSLRAIVRPGNSGGPLLDASGRVAGVVFARSLSDGDTGYALTLKQLQPLLTAGLTASAPVGTGACTSG